MNENYLFWLALWGACCFVLGIIACDRATRLFVRYSGYRISYDPPCDKCGLISDCYMHKMPECQSCLTEESADNLREARKLLDEVKERTR